MLDPDALYAQYQADLEDFWDRRRHEVRFRRQARVFGRLLDFASNQEPVLEAVEYCQPLYSIAPPDGRPPFSVQFVVRDGVGPSGPMPANLFDHIDYAGEGNWLIIRLGEFGVCHVDLEAGRAHAILATALAEKPALTGLYLLNTVLTNFFIAQGYAMLHASCLLREERALLLMAPHGSGKSTTALRLILSGWQLVSDSMVFLSPSSRDLLLLGFPVGKVKLRGDMLDHFPRLQPLLTSEQVRGETKYAVDLRQLDSALVREQGVRPSGIDLCLLRRSADGKTHLAPAPAPAVRGAVMTNSLFYDTPVVWRRNLALIDRLLQEADCYDLAIGVDAEGIVAALAPLI